jgi:dienelactone hydrolase
MAASVLLALSSWSTSVIALTRVLFGFVLRTTRVGLRPATWLGGATSYSCTTVSRGAADDLIYRIQRHGSPFAGAVLADDLVALEVLSGAARVDPGRLGAFGFSGGGGRSLLLTALDRRVAACVVSCMMATFASLVPAELDTHSWLLHVPSLWSLMDWPELTALGRARFLVQYRIDDELFPRAEMEQAHDHLRSLHAGNNRYLGSFSAGDHAFDAAMQEEAWPFLSDAL